MSAIDFSNPAAVRAEAERRLKLRAAGRETFGLDSGAWTTGSGATPPARGVTSADVAPAVAAGGERVRASRRGMNKTEARRAAELEAMRIAGEISAWAFEAVTLKLAHDCRYTPDFLVIYGLGHVRFEETKGHWRDDARVKIRVAAEKFPWFDFVALTVRKKKDGGGWHRESF